MLRITPVNYPYKIYLIIKWWNAHLFVWTYRIYEVCGMSAPSSGIAVGQIFGILNEFSPNQVGYDAEGLRLRIVMYIWATLILYLYPFAS